MVQKVKAKSKVAVKSKAKSKPKTTTKPKAKKAVSPAKPKRAVASKKPTVIVKSPAGAVEKAGQNGTKVSRSPYSGRREILRKMLLGKRQEIIQEIQEDLGNSLTADQQRRLESGMDSGDQALMDLDRELGISLLEMRNRKRQLIDEALLRVEEGTYGICAECEIEISEKRLEAVPFAKLCVECQSKQELLEKIEREEDRD